MMARQDLTRPESADLLESLLRTDTEGWKLLAFSVAAQTRGETAEELLGMFDALHRLTGDYPLDLAGRRPPLRGGPSLPQPPLLPASPPAAGRKGA